MRAVRQRALETSPREALRAHLGSWPGVALVAGVAVCGLVASRLSVWTARGSDPRSRAARILRETYGLDADPRSFSALPEPRAGRMACGDLAFLARRRGGSGPRDVYVVRTCIGPSGRLVRFGDPVNLSRTPRLDEAHLAALAGRNGTLVAYGVEGPQGCRVVHVVDTAGESRGKTAGWDWGHRMAARVTDWQETGRWRGLDRQSLEFDVPIRLQELAFRKGVLHIFGRREGAGRGSTVRVIFDPGARRLISAPPAVRHVDEPRGRRPLFNWLVDTVRGFSWVGPRKIAYLEVAVFWVRDVLKRLWYRLGRGARASSRALGRAGTGEVLAESKAYRPTRGQPRAPGWPPPPIRPIVPDPDPAEGRWASLPEGVIPRNPNAPEPVLQTFLHPDPERPYAVVGVFLWDPRQVELHLVGGTREPFSSTGLRGTGRIPRDSRILGLLAAFNGGFQTLHGDFGMQSEGRLIREPRRWAATVASYWDGTLAFGTWEAVPPKVPPRIRDFRQNLAPLLEDGRDNPLGNEYWGWAVRRYRERIYIVRSGLCLTREGYGAYFWGKAVSLGSLTRAMRMARCVYGMQMDINYTNASLELYRVWEVGRGGPRPPRRFPVGHKRVVRGMVPGSRRYAFEARNWLPGMYLSPFPRYIRVNWRDFGYLALRPILPGPDVVWRGRRIRWELPSMDGSDDAFPPRWAVAELDRGVRVAKLALDRLRPVLDRRKGVAVLRLPDGALERSDGTVLHLEQDRSGLWRARTRGQGRGIALSGVSDEAGGPGPGGAALGISASGRFLCVAWGRAPRTEQEEALRAASCQPAVWIAGASFSIGPAGPAPQAGSGREGRRALAFLPVRRLFAARLFGSGRRPVRVQFRPSSAAYRLRNFEKELRARGIDPQSREGRRLMREKLRQLRNGARHDDAR